MSQKATFRNPEQGRRMTTIFAMGMQGLDGARKEEWQARVRESL